MRLLIFYVSPTIVKQDSNSLTLSTVRFYYDCEGCYSLPLKESCGCCTRLFTLLKYGPTFRMVVKLSVDISITIAIAIQRLFKLKRLLLTHTYWYQKQGTEQVDSHTYTGNHRQKSQIINGVISVVAKIIELVMSSSAQAEVGALFMSPKKYSY